MLLANQKGQSKSARKRAETMAANKERQRKGKEIRGLICIGLGILFGIYLIAYGANIIENSGFLGTKFVNILFGLFGWPAYVLPVLSILSGIMIIRNSRNTETDGGPDWAFYVGMWVILILAHAIAKRPYSGVDYFKYIKDAFQVGNIGGGVVGAILCYPLQQFGGNVLAIIFCIITLLVIILLVTRFSLMEFGEKVTEKVQDAAQNVQGVRMAEPGVQRKKKLAVFETVDENDVEEEYDSSYTRSERKKKKEKQAGSNLDAFDAVLESVAPGDDGTVFSRKPKKEPATLDEWESFSPALKNKLEKKPRVEQAPIVPVANDSPVWQDTKARPYSGRKKVSDPSVEEPQPFAPVTSSFEVPTFLAATKSEYAKGSDIKTPEESKPKAQKKKVVAKADAPELPVSKPVSSGPYVPPPFDLLNPASGADGSGNENPMDAAKTLVDTLASFNIAVKVLDYSVGPVITRFELQPAPGVRVSKIVGLSNDLALALAAPRVRIEAPIPGKAAIGIEIPNKTAAPVVLREIVESRDFKKAPSPITLGFGKDIAGKIIASDLAKMPHLLIAGSTGSGKSVCINDLIISMIYKSGPADLRLILIDPKVVELSPFAPLPHLLVPVVTEPKKAASALRWAVNEMKQRYDKFSKVGSRDLQRYNELVKDPSDKLPKLVVIIDELADLMMVAPDDVEDSICRIAQLGRAAGIHLIVATQRPSADIITGLIKANIPSRCAFAVSSGIDSRIILDTMGAEKLLGRGDMLFHPNGANKPTRVQCAYVSDEEVERVVDYFKDQKAEPNFDDAFINEVTSASSDKGEGGVYGEGKQEDELLGEAVRIVMENGQASISMIQRRLRVGYARAARLIDIMEQHGYVSGFEGSKPRKVLIKPAEYDRIFNGTAEPEPSDLIDEEDLPVLHEDDPFEAEEIDE